MEGAASQSESHTAKDDMMTTEAQAPKKSSKPTIRERAAARVCPNCGKPSPERKSNKGPAPLYCRPEENGGRDCKRELANRNTVDAAAILPYLKAWRVDRGTGEIAQASFQLVCQMLDDLNEQDRKANRPRADYHAATLLAAHRTPVHELRYGRRKIAEHRAREAAQAPAAELAIPTFDW